MKALIRANDMLRDGIGVVLVLVALASPAAAQSGLSGIGSALFDGYYGAQMQQNYIEIQRQQIELMKRGIVVAVPTPGIVVLCASRFGTAPC